MIVKKRLAVLLPDLRGGGAERVALRLIEDFLKAGHEVDLLLQRREGELLPLVPRETRLVDLAAPRIRDAIAPLRRYFRERKPDAIQISMWPLTVVGLVAHRLAASRARVIVSDHTVLSKQYAGSAASLRMLKLTTRLFYPNADARILVSNGAADDLARISGIDRSTIEVIYNPLEAPPPGLSSTPEIESMWGATDGRILAVGTLKRVKNYELLIRSFAALRRCRGAKLMILGEGELRPRLESLAASLGISEDVMLPGFASRPWPFYASADLFVLSSDYEGFGNVIVEAMRCGLTVVSTDCESGPREILEDGNYGTLVPVGDERALAEAMERALRQPMDPARLRGRAEELSGQDCADRYLELMLGE